MPTLSVSVSYESSAELVDAAEELRDLWDGFEDGLLDLGPVLRELVREASLAADRAIREQPA